MPTPTDTRLLLDVMVGGLTSILRMLGYDVVYALDRDAEQDDALTQLAQAENRTVITRDRQIAARYDPTVLLHSTDTDVQLAELHEAGFELSLGEPARCSACNGRLVRVETGPGPAAGPDPEAEAVWQCRECGQYFWQGSHWDDVRDRLASITSD